MLFMYHLYFIAGLHSYEYKPIEIKVVSIQSPNNAEQERLYINKEEWNKIVELLNDYNKYEVNRQNIAVSVEELNGFYSTLFAAMTLIFAIIGVFGWSSMLKISRKLKEIEKVKSKVEFLHSKHQFAKWVQREFLIDDFEASFDLEFSSEDIDRINKYFDNFKEDQEDNVVAAVGIAKYLSDKKQKIDEADRIYKFIESTTVLPEDSKVKPQLYRLIGQFYRIKYDELRMKGIDSYDKAEELLLKSVDYYQKSMQYSLKEDQSRAKGNLAVVYIEMGKLKLKKYLVTDNIQEKENATLCFNMASENLEGEEDFNTYWDRARIEFYLANMCKNQKVEDLLWSTVNIIRTKKDGNIFIEKLRKEIKEFAINNKKGFPGDEVIIDRLEEKLRKKLI